MSEDNHEWQFRTVWRYDGKWYMGYPRPDRITVSARANVLCTELIVQRRRRRDHLDPTPCEGIEDPIWRDWIASDDPDIQGVLIAKGMPFRSLEK